MMKKLMLIVITALIGVVLITPNTVKASEISDTDRIKMNFINYLVGDKETNNLPISQGKVKGVLDAGQKALSDYEITEYSMFKDVILKNIPGEPEKTVAQLSGGLQDTTLRLNNLAMAYTTDFNGNNLYQNESVKDIIIEGLKHFYDEYYQDQELGYYGNWYNWEIGVPLNLSKTMLLLENEINEALPGYIESMIKTMDLYLRNGIDGDVDLAYRNYTGANLFDITFNRIVHGALLDNEARIDKSFSDMMSVFDSIDPDNIVNGVTDGYYEDGSILQHSTVAYTGSYGAVLLQRIGQTVTVLTGTKWQNKKLLDTVQLWIYTAFSPIIYEGYMMEIVKGRAVSRTSSGYVSNRTIIESFVELSKGLKGEEKTRLQSHIKYITSRQREKFNAGGFGSLQNILEYDAIMQDSNITAKNAIETNAHFAFNLMDKTVHLRDEFAFSISKSSNRVSKYEYMSGENMRSWFQGDGMTSLYLAGQDHNKSYGIDFYTTVDHYKLPGTTTPNEVRKTMRELYNSQFFEDLEYDMYSSSVKQNEFVYFPLGTNNYSGGVAHGNYGISSMQLGDEPSYLAVENGELPKEFVTYRNADANKSWFMFDNQIVALGSNITDVLGRKLTTTYDNRMYDADDTITVQKNDDANKSNALTVHSLNENSFISYVFLDDNKVNVDQSLRSQDRSYIREATAVGSVVNKQYTTLTVDHDGNERSDYAYVILPNADSSSRDQFIDENTIVILENSSNIHAVRHSALNLVGYASFTNESTKVEDLTTLSQMIIMRESNQFTVTDPTNEQKEVSFSLEGKFNTNHEKVRAEFEDGVTTFTLNTQSLNGMGINFEVVEVNEPKLMNLTDGEVEVSFTEGQLPEGTKLVVTQITDISNKGYDLISGYDIKFILDGKEIEPIGNVKITISNANVSSTSILIYSDSNLEFAINEGKAVFVLSSGGKYGFFTKTKEVEGDPVLPPVNEDVEIDPVVPPVKEDVEIDPVVPPVNEDVESGSELPPTGVSSVPVIPFATVLIFVGLLFRLSIKKTVEKD